MQNARFPNVLISIPIALQIVTSRLLCGSPLYLRWRPIRVDLLPILRAELGDEAVVSGLHGVDDLVAVRAEPGEHGRVGLEA